MHQIGVAKYVNLYFLVFACCFAATDTNTNEPVSTNTLATQNKPPPVSQPAPLRSNAFPMLAEPFHEEVYRSLDGETILTLISPNECEIAVNGTIYLCKCSKKDGKFRVVMSVLGTSQVRYFRITNEGLDGGNDYVLLAPKSYAAALERMRKKPLVPAEKKHEELQTKERKQPQDNNVTLEHEAIAAKRRAAALENAFKVIRGAVLDSEPTNVLDHGESVYVSYGLHLKRIYEDSWKAPTFDSKIKTPVEVKVIISKDGYVLSAKILKHSGNRLLDRSVEEVLSRVKRVPPFPEGSRDEKRDFRINFNLLDKIP